jgi:hypothetical protein
VSDHQNSTNQTRSAPYDKGADKNKNMEVKNMAQIIVPKAVDRTKYPGKLIFLDSEGNIAIADRPEPMSEAEKAKKALERQAEHSKEVAKRQAARKAMQDAKERLRKNPSVANAQEYEEAKAAYEAIKK